MDGNPVATGIFDEKAAIPKRAFAGVKLEMRQPPRLAIEIEPRICGYRRPPAPPSSVRRQAISRRQPAAQPFPGREDAHGHRPRTRWITAHARKSGSSILAESTGSTRATSPSNPWTCRDSSSAARSLEASRALPAARISAGDEPLPVKAWRMRTRSKCRLSLLGSSNPPLPTRGQKGADLRPVQRKKRPQHPGPAFDQERWPPFRRDQARRAPTVSAAWQSFRPDRRRCGL